MTEAQASELLTTYLESENRVINFIGTKQKNEFGITLDGTITIYLTMKAGENGCMMEAKVTGNTPDEFKAYLYGITYEQYKERRQLFINQIML